MSRTVLLAFFDFAVLCHNLSVSIYAADALNQTARATSKWMPLALFCILYFTNRRNARDIISFVRSSYKPHYISVFYAHILTLHRTFASVFVTLLAGMAVALNIYLQTFHTTILTESLSFTLMNGLIILLLRLVFFKTASHTYHIILLGVMTGLLMASACFDLTFAGDSADCRCLCLHTTTKIWTANSPHPGCHFGNAWR